MRFTRFLGCKVEGLGLKCGLRALIAAELLGFGWLRGLLVIFQGSLYTLRRSPGTRFRGIASLLAVFRVFDDTKYWEREWEGGGFAHQKFDVRIRI